MKKQTYQSWLDDLKKIIATSRPRATMTPLRNSSYQFRYSFTDKHLTNSELEELLCTLEELRNSRCNDRIDFEHDILSSFYLYLSHTVFFDNPLDFHGELIPTFQEPSEEVKSLHLGNFKLLASHLARLLKAKPLKLTDYPRLINKTFTLLNLLTHRPELQPLLKECLNTTRALYLTNDLSYMDAGVEFIDSYYYKFSKNHQVPEEIINELDALLQRTKHDMVAVTICDFFIGIGKMSEFGALDFMDDFRDREECKW